MRTRTTVSALRNRVAIGIVVGIGAATMIMASPVSAAPATTTDTVVSGVITKDDKPVSGANLVTMAWPNADVLQRMAPGQPVNRVLIGETRTDRHGRFALSVDSARLTSDHIGADGTIDIELFAADAEHQIRWNFSATRNRPGSRITWANPRIDRSLMAQRMANNSAPVHLRIDLGEKASVLEDGNHPQDWVDIEGTRLGARGISVAQVVREPRSNAKTASGDVSTLGMDCPTASNSYKWGKVEEFVRAIGIVGAMANVNQQYGTSHTLGIAVSSNSGGTWSLGGSFTHSLGGSANTQFGPTSLVHNKVNYRMFYDRCAPHRQEWRYNSLHSLNTGYTSISRPYWNTGTNCTPYSNGKYTKDSGSNVTFSAGVKLDVINVSAKASFTSKTQLWWQFTRTGKLCGSSSFGWYSSAEAGAYV